MIYITVPDMNDSISDIKLDGKNYKIRFTYNSKYDYWSFGIANEEGEFLIAMTKIVPSYPLLITFSDVRLPDGQFGCTCSKEHVGRKAFVNGEANFVFIPRKEV